MMLSEFEDLAVIDAKGRVAGRVTRVLFDGATPALVGFEVRMRPLAYLIDRPLRYVPRTGVTLSKRGLTLVPPARLERARGRAGGIEWDATVVWSGMPVVSESAAPGEDPLGVVKDVDLGAEGRVRRLVLSRGATSDVAVGIREIDGERVLGFAGGAVRVADEVARPQFSGGVAAGAGKTAAVAKVRAEQAAVGAVRAAAAATRAARRSGIGKRASASWKGFAEGLREGYADDERSDDAKGDRS